ncbi:MAG: carboxypeptidase regulatory-like domain-containing protein [Patescibacteria group bacterium]
MEKVKKFPKTHSRLFLTGAAALVLVIGIYSAVLYPLTGTKAIPLPPSELADASAAPQGLADGVTGAEDTTWTFTFDNTGGEALTAFDPPGVMTQDMIKITLPNVEQGSPWFSSPDDLVVTANPGATGLIFQGNFYANDARLTYDGQEYVNSTEDGDETAIYYNGGGMDGMISVSEDNTEIDLADGINDFNLALCEVVVSAGGEPVMSFPTTLFARNDNYPDAATLETEVDSWTMDDGEGGEMTIDLTIDLWAPAALTANGANTAYTWNTPDGVTFDQEPTLYFDAQKILDHSQPDGPPDIIKIPLVDGQDALGEFSITIVGLNVPTAPLANLEDLEFMLETCRLADPTQPDSECATLESGVSVVTVDRLGEMIPYNADFDLYPANYATGENTNYTISFTAPSGLSDTNKIVWQFPGGFILTAADVEFGLPDINGTGADTPAIAPDDNSGLGGGIYANTINGKNQLELTVTGTVNPGDQVTITVKDIYNPNMVDVYRGFGIYTALANGGIIDGLPANAGQEPERNGPSLLESLPIGGTNTIIGTVKKDEGAGPVPLEADEATQIMIGLGCPDKGYFVGQKYLQPDGSFTYNNLLDCNYKMNTEPTDKENNPTFFMDFLQPAMLDIPAQGGQSFTVDPTFIVPDAYISGTITSDDSVGGSQIVFMNAFNSTHMSWSPVFQEDPIANPAAAPGLTAEGTGYFVLPVKSDYTWSINIMINNQTQTLIDLITDDEYWPPVISPVVVAEAGETYDIGANAFVKADKTLNIFLRNAQNDQIMNSACVAVRRPNPMGFMGGFAKCSSQNIGDVQGYQFKVPSGALLVDIGQWGLGKPIQKQITVKASDNAVDKTFYLEMPTSHIDVTVEDSDGNPLNQVSLFAHGSNGFGQAVTGSQGQATIYVREGVYRVEGFVPNLGQLDDQDGIVVNEETSPEITFTVDVSELNIISGVVYIDANSNSEYDAGEGVSGAQIGCHGPDGGNGTVTLTDGTYQLRVKAGTYKVGGWSNQTGGLPEQEIDASGGDVEDVDFAISSPGTLRITVEGAAGLEFFAGAHNPTTHKGNGTNVWTTTGDNLVTTLPLPEGTYNLHVGSPAFGEISNPGGDQATIVAGQTTAVSYTLPDFNTLSGTVTDGTDPVENAEVWAANKNGPGFGKTLTDANGDYSLKLTANFDYDVGANVPGYISTVSNIEDFDGDVADYDLVITEATGVITGTVIDGGGDPLNQGFAWAEKSGEDAWVGAPVEANGTFELPVDDGIWVVHADSPCYQPDFEGNEAQDGDDLEIELTYMEGCEPPKPKMNAITPASGGTIYNDEDEDGTNDVEVVIPANALGTGSDNVTFSVTPNDNPISTPNATPLKAEDLDATSASGGAISSLNTNIEITIDYGSLDLPDDFDESTMQLAYFDSASNNWVAIASTVNTSNETITAQADHLTTFGIITNVPDAPTSPSAEADGTEITLCWNTSTGATSYNVYRSDEEDGTYTAVGSNESTGYTDSDLEGETTYYYKITAVNSAGESAYSEDTNATTGAASGGRNDVPGGGGSATVPTTPTAPTTTTAGSTALTVGQGGTTTATTSTGSTLVINVPAGAMTSATTLSVTPQTNAEAAAPAPAATSGLFMVGNLVFEIDNSSGQKTFTTPLTLTFNYTDAQISGLDENSLKVYWYDPVTSQWQQLTTTINTATNTLTATISHLTVFGILGTATTTEQPEGPAEQTLPTGIKLYRSPSVSTVFLIDETAKTKRPVFNEIVFLAMDYNWSDVQFVSESKLAEYTLGKMLLYPEGSVIKFLTSPKVFKVGADYMLHWITNETVFSRLGYSWNQVKDLTDSFWSLFKESTDVN